jgi:hypothetical protein
MRAPWSKSMSWTVNDNQVVCDYGQVVSFDYPIRELLNVGEFAVIVLDVPPDAVMTENVFGLTRDCRISWQIERSPSTASDPVNVYVGASRLVDRPSVVVVTNWNGIAAYVDVSTGRILETMIVK